MKHQYEQTAPSVPNAKSDKVIPPPKTSQAIKTSAQRLFDPINTDIKTMFPRDLLSALKRRRKEEKEDRLWGWDRRIRRRRRECW